MILESVWKVEHILSHSLAGTPGNKDPFLGGLPPHRQTGTCLLPPGRTQALCPPCGPSGLPSCFLSPHPLPRWGPLLRCAAVSPSVEHTLPLHAHHWKDEWNENLTMHSVYFSLAGHQGSQWSTRPTVPEHPEMAQRRARCWQNSHVHATLSCRQQRLVTALWGNLNPKTCALIYLNKQIHLNYLFFFTRRP